MLKEGAYETSAEKAPPHLLVTSVCSNNLLIISQDICVAVSVSIFNMRKFSFTSLVIRYSAFKEAFG